MSLKKCRECACEVSSKAKICPNCGIKTPYVDSIFVTLAKIGVGTAFFMYMFNLCITTTNTKPSKVSPQSLKHFCEQRMISAASGIGGKVYSWGQEKSWKKGYKLFFGQQNVVVKDKKGNLLRMHTVCIYNTITKEFKAKVFPHH